MGILEIVLIGVGLAMDAFAVSVCKGLSMRKLDWRKAIIIALYFGIFQAIMPVIGYFLGYTFKGLSNTNRSLDCIYIVINNRIKNDKRIF